MYKIKKVDKFNIIIKIKILRKFENLFGNEIKNLKRVKF